MPANRILIVGQGLAGTLLAFRLKEYNLDVSIIDDGHQTAASTVGIAVINPVTGRRYAKSWNIDELTNMASDTYARLEDILGYRYLSRTEILQILPDERIEELWLLRAGDPEFQKYLNTEIQTLETPGLVHFRYAKILNALHLRVTAFIDDAQRWFLEQGMLTHEVFVPGRMEVMESEIQYDGQSYTHVVFCEGQRITSNPLFEGMEIYPMKGEYLICKIPGLDLHAHVKSTVSLIPMETADTYWCGSTYDRYNDSDTPTAAGREYLFRHLSELVTLPVEIMHQGVGIRATTRDRRPYIGTHPDHPRVHLIAGLGTKGASLAPYCAEHLGAMLATRSRIPMEVDILRHYA